MGIFTGFERGSGGRYVFDEEARQLVKVSEQVTDPNAGLNGPVYFPKGGTPYFDKALRRTFHSLSEKKAFMREHKLTMAGEDKEFKGVEAQGVGKTYYSYAGQKTCNRGYKYR